MTSEFQKSGPPRSPHIPVMLNEVCETLSKTDKPFSKLRIVDATFGAGGYTTTFLERGASVFAFDRDPNAINAGRTMETKWSPRLSLIEGRFGDMVEHLAARDVRQVDAVVMDIGVSSMQLDQAERGFSFQSEGPLDMRMSQSGPSAADVVNRLGHGELAHIFKFLGDDRNAGRIASAVLRRREQAPFRTTIDLVQTILSVTPRKAKDRIHPATRVFQALRIFVNGELHQLATGLSAAETLLRPGGVLIVVTFHSLEDRIAKNFLKSRSEPPSSGSRHAPGTQDEFHPSFEPGFKKALAASETEASANPRARSAKLRFGVRTASPAHAMDFKLLGVPDLPSLHTPALERED